MTNKKNITFRNQRIKELKELLKKTNGKIYGVVNHIAPSGLSRRIMFFVFSNNNKYNITPFIRDILLPNNKIKPHEGLLIKGGGMDMVFYTIYELSNVLYGAPYKLTAESLS